MGETGAARGLKSYFGFLSQSNEEILLKEKKQKQKKTLYLFLKCAIEKAKL